MLVYRYVFPKRGFKDTEGGSQGNARSKASTGNSSIEMISQCEIGKKCKRSEVTLAYFAFQSVLIVFILPPLFS